MAIEFLTQVPTEVAAGPLDQVLLLLQNFGFFRVVLPFLLIFAIFWAVLLKTKVLGDTKESPAARPASAIVAFVAAFLVLIYTPVIDALAILLPQASFLLVVIVLLLMVLAMFGISFKDPMTEKLNIWMAVIALIIVVLFVAMIGVAVGPQIPVLNAFSQALLGGISLNLTEETIAMAIGIIIILAVIGGIIYMVKSTGE